MKLFTLSVLLMLSILSGCATTDTNINYKTIAVLPPDNLIMDCLIEPPPDRNIYVTSNEKEREMMLYELSMKQMKNTFICNNRLNKLREWKKQQISIYSEVK